MEDEFVGKSSTVRPKFTRCVPCRKSHMGCDSLRPACTQCLSKGKECFYRQYTLSSASRHVSRKGPTLTKYSDYIDGDVASVSSPGEVLKMSELLASSTLLDELNNACDEHLEFLGMKEYKNTYDPSALLMLGLIAEKLQKKYQKQNEG